MSSVRLLDRPATSLSDRSEAIRSAVLEAILEQRLPNGTKLGEDEIGGIFGVSRTVVRAALQRLAHDRLVVIERHRGAYVASPTADEARQIFEARRTIEPSIAREAAQRHTAADAKRLAEHMQREERARRSADRGVALRLSGEFHLRLAEVARNDILAGFLEELISRSSLVVTLYGRVPASACGDDEHQRIAEFLLRRDEAGAAAAMLSHLDHIEADVDLGSEAPSLVDLAAILLRRDG